MDPTDACERAFVAHWGQLGRLPGGRLHEEGGVVWAETPVGRLPYNGVPETRLADGAAADAAIERITGRYRERGVDFWWFHHPSATPVDLGDRLARVGMRAVEQMHFMSLELDGWEASDPKPGVSYEVVSDAAARREYLELTLAYWEIPADQADAVAELHRGIDGLPGRRYLARLDGEAIGKAYLSWPGPAGVAAIYGMSVRPEARGHGVASGLSTVMLRDARDELGCGRAVLHSTDIAVGVYRRLGFQPCGAATVYATAELWSKEDG